jgi:hypothetical protein
MRPRLLRLLQQLSLPLSQPPATQLTHSLSVASKPSTDSPLRRRYLDLAFSQVPASHCPIFPCFLVFSRVPLVPFPLVLFVLPCSLPATDMCSQRRLMGASEGRICTACGRNNSPEWRKVVHRFSLEISARFLTISRVHKARKRCAMLVVYDGQRKLRVQRKKARLNKHETTVLPADHRKDSKAFIFSNFKSRQTLSLYI